MCIGQQLQKSNPETPVLTVTPKKPTFLIIGSAKCGTTALASVLGAHPDCCIGNPKEVNFFQDIAADLLPDDASLHPNLNYEKGWDWYRQAFVHYKGESVIGEASPAYSDRTRAPNTAKRIFEFNPDMKIIYLVRHPLERQISAWKMNWAEGVGNVFPNCRQPKWALEGFDYWMCSQRDVKRWDECCYYFQLNAYLEYFPINRILVSFSKDRILDRKGETERIMRFLGLDPERLPKDFHEDANRVEDRTIDRPILKQMRMHPVSRRLIRRFPNQWRNWARNNIAHVSPVPPKPELSERIRTEFICFVKQDVENFLKQWHKPSDFWLLE